MESSYKKIVAVVIPRYRTNLSSDEMISLNHLTTHLGKYDKFFIVPDDLSIDTDHFYFKKFGRSYFEDVYGYNELMLSKEFYESFEAYSFILIYQLDCLVFSDQLLEWCEKDYDYIGAPWFDSGMSRVKKFSVGNGGFSLRKVDRFIEVLRKRVNPKDRLIQRSKAIADLFLYAKPKRQMKRFFASLMDGEVMTCMKEKYRFAKRIIGHYSGNEDTFWSYEAKKYFPEFKVAPPEVALSFAFEADPRYCYQKNHYSLPFGCHAWAKYDRSFWGPYLISRSNGVLIDEVGMEQPV